LEIDDKREQVAVFLANNPKGAEDKTTADMGRHLEAQLGELLNRADALHKTEKAPHLEAGRLVDQTWRIRDDIKGDRKSLKVCWGAFAIAEEARARKRLAEEQEKHDAQLAAIPLNEIPDNIPEPPKLEKVSVGGGVGNKASLVDHWSADVADWDALAVFFANDVKVQSVLQALANQMAKASKGSATIPGVTIKHERKAR